MRLQNVQKKFMSDLIQVEICYANPQEQFLISVAAPKNSTVLYVIQNSNILERFSELKLDQLVVGIFGKKCTLDTVINEGDRIEIYRPLTIDPKVARRLRAAKKNLKNKLI